MARDNEDIYLKNTLDSFCTKLTAGLICQESAENVKRVSIIRGINSFVEGYGDDTEICEDATYIESPSIICLDGTQSIDAEYPFIVGDPIVITDILYGWYDLNPATQPNPITPSADDLAVDIAANPGNYTSTPWVPLGVSANIINTQIAYHVVRTPISIAAINIVDEAGVSVNAAWSTLTDGTYNYYVLMRPVMKNANVTYTLKE